MDVHYHLNDKVIALKSMEVEIMVARNTWANLVHGAWASVVHTTVNGVKSAGNGVKSLENDMKSPGNPMTFF